MFLLICLTILLSAVIEAAEQSLEGHKLVRFWKFGKGQSDFLDSINADVWGEDDELATALVHLDQAQFWAVHNNGFLFTNFTVIENDLSKSVQEERTRIELHAVSAKSAMVSFICIDIV